MVSILEGLRVEDHVGVVIRELFPGIVLPQVAKYETHLICQAQVPVKSHLRVHSNPFLSKLETAKSSCQMSYIN